MTDKRALLVARVQELLGGVESGWRVVDRFKREVIISESRRDRVAVMGDPARYAEVLYEPNMKTGGTAGATWRNDVHLFQIRLWRGFHEDPDSQDVWDELIEGDSGILHGLANTGKLGNFTLFNPSNIVQAMRFLDGEGKEISHYIELTIEIR